MDREAKPYFQNSELPLVLIVEDEVPIAETLAEVVKELGYVPIVAQNGQQALMLARDRWPALVLTDLMMPVLDGAAFVKALRSEATERKIKSPPVILLTAAGVSAVAGLAVEALIAKPFDLDHLEQLIRQLL